MEKNIVFLHVFIDLYQIWALKNHVFLAWFSMRFFARCEKQDFEKTLKNVDRGDKIKGQTLKKLC